MKIKKEITWIWIPLFLCPFVGLTLAKWYDNTVYDWLLFIGYTDPVADILSGAATLGLCIATLGIMLETIGKKLGITKWGVE